MTTLIMPMAGAGSRFVQAGYDTPKPFLPTGGGLPLFIGAWADAATALGKEPTASVFLVREEHRERAEAEFATYIGLPATFVSVPELTDGAASTAQLAEPFALGPVLVTNCDQHVRLGDPGVRTFRALRERGDSPVVLCFEASESKWSYLDGERIVEKPAVAPPSRAATCGLYWFPSAVRMFAAIRSMKSAGDRVNGEFYFAPCINHLYDAYPFALFVEEMVGLGTPEDYRAYLDRPSR